ncbi:MAG: acylhydrolase, partial [Butyrivibrio sp.]|nr:acylhydrolase [Butyrivibrio sp.]
QEQYSKIYIMLGLNEIGTGNEGYFAQAYVDVLHKIEDLQPDAIIYIQGIMHVTEAKSSNDKNFNNDRINLRNKVLSELADNRRVFYIDMNGEVDDGRGNLDSDLSFDDVHLKASAYERWHQFLLHNAIVR